MSDARKHHTSHLPPSIIERLIQDVWDPLESKVILTVAALAIGDHPVAQSEVLAYPALQRGARGNGSDRDVSERISEALQAAVAHGILIALSDETGARWYALATHQTMRIVREGTYIIASERETPETLIVDRPDVFGLYEQNIGIVTPILADRLSEALDTYPEEWIRDAISEAVAYNRRNWRYIQRILENWITEGRADETNRRDNEKHLDSEKYLRGKYAALFRRR